MSNKDPNLRFIGKVKEVSGKNGSFLKIMLDDPKPLKDDGTPNQYYKGTMIWIDAESGKKYIVKQIQVKGVSEQAAQHGFTNSLCIKLDNSYDVEEAE